MTALTAHQLHPDEGDRWRLNIHVGPAVFTQLLGYPPEQSGGDDVSPTKMTGGASNAGRAKPAWHQSNESQDSPEDGLHV